MRIVSPGAATARRAPVAGSTDCGGTGPVVVRFRASGASARLDAGAHRAGQGGGKQQHDGRRRQGDAQRVGAS